MLLQLRLNYVIFLPFFSVIPWHQTTASFSPSCPHLLSHLVERWILCRHHLAVSFDSLHVAPLTRVQVNNIKRIMILLFFSAYCLLFVLFFHYFFLLYCGVCPPKRLALIMRLSPCFAVAFSMLSLQRLA